MTFFRVIVSIFIVNVLTATAHANPPDEPKSRGRENMERIRDINQKMDCAALLVGQALVIRQQNLIKYSQATEGWIPINILSKSRLGEEISHDLLKSFHRRAIKQVEFNEIQENIRPLSTFVPFHLRYQQSALKKLFNILIGQKTALFSSQEGRSYEGILIKWFPFWESSSSPNFISLKTENETKTFDIEDIFEIRIDPTQIQNQVFQIAELDESIFYSLYKDCLKKIQDRNHKIFEETYNLSQRSTVEEVYEKFDVSRLRDPRIKFDQREGENIFLNRHVIIRLKTTSKIIHIKSQVLGFEPFIPDTGEDWWPSMVSKPGYLYLSLPDNYEFIHNKKFIKLVKDIENFQKYLPKRELSEKVLQIHLHEIESLEVQK